jgi:GH25 family lysozyme M1 (1,4-beta-N-acetylmuramidase)
MTAIDTSYWNGHPDFAQVKASGVTLAIMKCADGEGSTIVDDSVYVANRTAARAVGLAVGSYFFNGNAVSPTTAAGHQFGICDYRAGDWVAIDIEGGTGIVWTVGQTLEWVRAMLAHGVPATALLVYMSAAMTTRDWSSVIATGARLWVASYGANDPASPGPHGSPAVGQWGSYALWQYTSVASCPGVSGHVDASIFGTATASITSTPITETTQAPTTEENTTMKPVIVVCTDGPNAGVFAVISANGFKSIQPGRPEPETAARKIVAAAWSPATPPADVRLTGAEWLFAPAQF